LNGINLIIEKIGFNTDVPQFWIWKCPRAVAHNRAGHSSEARISCSTCSYGGSPRLYIAHSKDQWFSGCRILTLALSHSRILAFSLSYSRFRTIVWIRATRNSWD
jgi:hypothetical protein